MRERRRPSISPIRTILMIVLGSGSLAALAALGLLDLGRVWGAFRDDPADIGLAAAGVAALAILGAARYALLLRFFRLAAPLRRVLAANLISQAVGQWTSGAMAVAEVLRFGLMTGFASDDAGGQEPAAGTKARLGVSLLVDRVLGFGAAFAAGGAAGLFLLLQGGAAARSPALLLVMTAFSLAVGAALLAGPFLRRGRRAAARLARFLSRKPGRIAAAVRNFVLALEMWPGDRSGRPRRAAALCLSAATALVNPLTLFFSAAAIGHPLPMLVILIAVPFTVLAIIIPAGIAGFGGPQLLAAGVFGLFRVDAAAVVAACLLQNAVVLVVQSFLGGAGAALSLDRLRPAGRSK